MAGGRQLLAAFGVLVAIQLLTSTVAIALLTRMSPAIEHILEENVTSVEAVEGMLEILARSPDLDAADRRTYRELLERASANVTEPGEREALRELRDGSDAALSGDPQALADTAAALRELGRVNRQAMRQADDEAKRLGTAGAWAAALLGIIGLAVSLIALERSRRRILSPVAEMIDVVQAHEAGEIHRRCTVERSGSPELGRVMQKMNRLLDHRERPSAGHDEGEPVGRLALLALLDDRDAPTVVVGPEGELLAANRAADAALAGPEGRALREALHAAARGEETSWVVERRPLGDEGAQMCSLSSVE